MKPSVSKSDFAKIKKFIDTNCNTLSATSALVRELSSTDLYIGTSHVYKEQYGWMVIYDDEKLKFATKRNAMYAAFLIAYKHKDLIKSLCDIDKRMELSKIEIEHLKELLRLTQDAFKTELFHNKLSESVAKYRKAKNELHDWMDCAKYINY
jgi:hypothetical protein